MTRLLHTVCLVVETIVRLGVDFLVPGFAFVQEIMHFVDPAQEIFLVCWMFVLVHVRTRGKVGRYKANLLDIIVLRGVELAGDGERTLCFYAVGRLVLRVEFLF